MELLPAALSPAASLGLIALACLTSAITAALGLGGGVLMLAAMASLLPAPAIIPVHAVIQLGSNAGRAAMMRRHIDLARLWPLLLGSIAGATLGGVTVVQLPAAALQLVLAAFILYSSWASPPALSNLGWRGLALGGAVASYLTMFVGATGPFIAAMLRPLGLERARLVATHAVAMLLQHGVKMLVFGLLGFAYGPWLGLIALMIASGLIGTWLGRHILHRLPQAGFDRALRWLLTILALNLVRQALM